MLKGMPVLDFQVHHPQQHLGAILSLLTAELAGKPPPKHDPAIMANTFPTTHLVLMTRSDNLKAHLARTAESEINCTILGKRRLLLGFGRKTYNMVEETKTPQNCVME